MGPIGDATPIGWVVRMPVDELWYHADRAKQQAEQAYHRLDEAHEADIERETQRSVSLPRFKQLAERTEHTGAPFGAHTIVHDSAGEVILVRHEEIGRWVLPGARSTRTNLSASRPSGNSRKKPASRRRFEGSRS